MEIFKTTERQLPVLSFFSFFYRAAVACPFVFLGKKHDAKQLHAIEFFDAGISVMALHDSPNRFPWHEIHELSEQRFPVVHGRSRMKNQEASCFSGDAISREQKRVKTG